jgi:hypothetical protein
MMYFEAKYGVAARGWADSIALVDMDQRHERSPVRAVGVENKRPPEGGQGSDPHSDTTTSRLELPVGIERIHVDVVDQVRLGPLPFESDVDRPDAEARTHPEDF